jgi:FkbM family methyltransferase
MFAELSENYSSYDNVKCLNVAIGEINGVKRFFTVSDSPSLPGWTNQLSTFDKEQILKFAPDLQGIEDNIVETSVDCLTFDYVVRKELKNGVDVVLIDVEGFDAKRVKKHLNLPKDAEITMIVAVGKGTEKGIHSERMRVPLEEVIFIR